MRTHKALAGLVRDALLFSNTSQETLATACDVPLPVIKSFLVGRGTLTVHQWKVIKGALGITAPRGRPRTKRPR